jgi:MFS family permease
VTKTELATGRRRWLVLAVVLVGTFMAILDAAIGGLLLAANLFGLTWRPAFLVNVPFAILAVVAAVVILPADDVQQGGSLDLGGVALATVTLVLLVVPLLEGRELGWPAWTIASLVAAVVAGAGFIRYERRVAAQGGVPLVRLDLFRNPGFASGVPIAELFMCSYAGFLLLMAIYLQIGLGFSPLAAGLAYTPSAIGFFVTSLLCSTARSLEARATSTQRAGRTTTSSPCAPTSAPPPPDRMSVCDSW